MTPRPDVFRRWLAGQVTVAGSQRDLAVRLGVVEGSVRKWRKGGGVHRDTVERVITEAARDGVALTFADLVPRHRRNGK